MATMKPRGREKQRRLKAYRKDGKSEDWLKSWERGWHQHDKRVSK